MVPSRGQAALLTFCTCISLGSVGLVLSIAVPEGGNNWFWLMTLSPLAYVYATHLSTTKNEYSTANVLTVVSCWSRGVYYWTKASRKEEIKVKMILSDDQSLSEILVRGDDVQVEQMRKELKFSEKGMIYVKGIFET
jgi:hypothetical protein